MSNTQPRLPTIGEYVHGEGTLVAIEPPPPAPLPPDDYIFEEVTARIELRLLDYTLKEFGTFWDAYGRESCVVSAINEAKEYVARREISADEKLEVVVIRIVSRVRKHVIHGENFRDNQFLKFDSVSLGCRIGMPDVEETVVWSSKTKYTNTADQQ